MCWVSNERRENALDNEAYSLIKSCVATKISYWAFPRLVTLHFRGVLLLLDAIKEERQTP